MFTYLLTDLPVVSTISVDVKHHVYLLTYWSPRSQYDLCGRKAPCLLTYLLTGLPVVSMISVDVKHHVYLLTGLPVVSTVSVDAKRHWTELHRPLGCECD